MSDPIYTGWIRDDEAVDQLLGELPYPVAGDTPAGQHDHPLPDHVHLWQFARQVTGNLLPPATQGDIGSCVSFGTARAIEYSMCAEIASGDKEEFRKLAEECIYGGARVEVAGGRLRGDGAVGAWAAKWVSATGGLIPRGKFGSIDLSSYSVDRCRKYGISGVPDELEPESRKHQVMATQVRNWTEAKRMLASGYGISVCSSQGFSMKRDANGIAKPSGSWAHCMCLCGYSTIGGEEYGRIDNSWGASTHTGPTGPGDPGPEGFYASSAVIDKMLRQNDSWAFSAIAGFPVRRLSWTI